MYLQAWNCIWKQDKCCESAEESHCIYCPGKACKHLLQVLSWICFVYYNTALSCWFFGAEFDLLCPPNLVVVLHELLMAEQRAFRPARATGRLRT